MNNAEERRAARLILLDSTGRILLFRHARRNGETFWAPPGGGLETGETFELAALREASEELGLVYCSVKFLWENNTEFVYIDRPVCQREQYFLIEGPLSGLLFNVRSTHEREGIVETKWWTIGDLEATKEPVFPEDLAPQLKAISI